jgi:hypothetical protein
VFQKPKPSYAPTLASILIMRVVTIILVLELLLSCTKEKTNNLEYIFIKRRGGYLDTLHRELIYSTRTDTFNTISYKTIWNSDTLKEEFKFPTKSEFDTLTDFKLLDERSIYFGDREYTIIKYLYDDIHADDEETLYFYSPEFGVLIFKSRWWGNYDRLTRTGDNSRDIVVFYLEEMIANNDKEFFY